MMPDFKPEPSDAVVELMADSAEAYADRNGMMLERYEVKALLAEGLSALSDAGLAVQELRRFQDLEAAHMQCRCNSWERAHGTEFVQTVEPRGGEPERALPTGEDR